MTYHIMVIYIFAYLFLSKGYYTVINQNNLENVNLEYHKEYVQNVIINNKLVGVWINKKLLIDYGYQFRRLEINYDGRVVYIPDSESSNSKVYYGNYSAFSDTLTIWFEGRKNSEWMKYRLNADTLYLYGITESESTEYKLIDDCHYCRRTWIKIQ